eukprot:CAMPEP_0197325062 /NCGR_PEP_ID=MMETSP0891-20130614/71462_1 /TAXON_ID=44058 ORGANISM="Aureoumbra lagunensis, Strain CCMP1510" /NCGR_SAMPLE_ID=MMETSP0891 /ASSEMBLY_ACC=CAM_ASM_000534 /LENGTH=152 /DNA_ID=CAMNT_0042817965 /DNA_START=1129 /DNA_END=1584 /DNA_ORIENTATION=+
MLRCEQMHSMLLQKPNIIAGDLNAFPSSAAIKLATQGYVHSSHEDLAQYNKLNDNDSYAPTSEIKLSSAYDLSSFTDASPSSSPSSSALYYTHVEAHFRATLDYILIDDNIFETAATLPVPNLADMLPNSNDGFPTLDYPSDHILLAADLRI